jgi:hypothetical protein
MDALESKLRRRFGLLAAEEHEPRRRSAGR